MANPKVVLTYLPPRASGFRYEGEGFPFSHLVNEVELLRADFLATQKGFPHGDEYPVPASLTLEYDPAAEKVTRSAQGLFPPCLAVHCLTMLLFDVVDRQRQAMFAEAVRRQAGAVEAATPEALARRLR